MKNVMVKMRDTHKNIKFLKEALRGQIKEKGDASTWEIYDYVCALEQSFIDAWTEIPLNNLDGREA